jgi:hypothetical protein
MRKTRERIAVLLAEVCLLDPLSVAIWRGSLLALTPPVDTWRE